MAGAGKPEAYAAALDSPGAASASSVAAKSE
jgi:hypothetical protein